jgi:hypothetical protein
MSLQLTITSAKLKKHSDSQLHMYGMLILHVLTIFKNKVSSKTNVNANNSLTDKQQISKYV